MEIHSVHAGEFEEKQREVVEARVRGLAGEKRDLIDVRILVRQSCHQRHGDAEVRLTCDARGREIVVTRSRPEAGQALDEGVDVFEREVRRMSDRRAIRRSPPGASGAEARSA
jgi:ribosome-associated translation inhibitor RaiA